MMRSSAPLLSSSGSVPENERRGGIPMTSVTQVMTRRGRHGLKSINQYLIKWATTGHLTLSRSLT